MQNIFVFYLEFIDITFTSVFFLLEFILFSDIFCFINKEFPQHFSRGISVTEKGFSQFAFT